MENSPLTRHGKKRAKERVGLDRRAAARTAAMALRVGLHARETRGALRRYLDGKSAAHEGAEPRVHGLHVYIFGEGKALITVWELPHEFRRAAASARERRVC